MASTLSQFFGGGRFITDPTLFPRVSRGPAGVFRDTVASSSASFWTGNVDAIDRIPGSVEVNTDWTADVYKTIANLTATKSGLVSHFIGPVLTTAADTCTMRFTIDGGTATTAVLTAQTNGDRVVLGAITDITIFADNTLQFDGVSSDGLTGNLSTSAIRVFTPSDLFFMGAPLLRFTSSLLVEMKASVNITGTASQERRAGVVLQRTT